MVVVVVAVVAAGVSIVVGHNGCDGGDCVGGDCDGGDCDGSV